MDPSRLVLDIARTALGGGKKKAGKARGFLSSSGLMTPAGLLGAAGVAWGVWETLQAKGGGAATIPPPPAPSPAGPARGAAVAAEIARPTPLAEILRDAPPSGSEELYVLAFTVVRADEGVSGSERVCLAHLASRLGLAPDRTAALEARTTAAIDAAPTS